MLIWIFFIGLLAIVVAFLARPLVRSAAHNFSPTTKEADIAVYQDQLAEIDADLARGLIAPDDAETARNELSRRLLRYSDGDGKKPKPIQTDTQHPTLSKSALEWPLIGAIAITLSLISLVSYLTTGSPELPARPFAERLKETPENASLNELIGKIELRLRTRPDDGKGWDLLAPIYLQQRRYGDAVTAFESAIRILGETPKRLVGYGKALVGQANGIVGPIAQKAFEQALKSDPELAEPKLWLATGYEQDGQLPKAVSILESLLTSYPKDVPWRKMVEQRVKDLTARSTETGKTP